MYGTQDNRQLGKIVRKKRKKILIEHWQMQSKESELTTEINICDRCRTNENYVKESCQQWIRVNNKINVIPNTLIEKGDNKISAAIDQLTERVKTESQEKEELRLEESGMLEGLEAEIVKRQMLRENVNQEIIKSLKRNVMRNKNRYTIYTDSAVNRKEEVSSRKMGIR